MLGFKMFHTGHLSLFPEDVEFEKVYMLYLLKLSRKKEKAYQTSDFSVHFDEDECNGLWLSSSDFSAHLTEFHKHETEYLNSDLEDTRCGYEIVVPGYMIPLWFRNQSGDSLSFWIGSEFQALALCFAFDLPMGNTYSYVCDVRISINGFKRELKVQLFEEMSIDHLWFYYISKSSLQQLFKDMNLGSMNFVKVLCRVSCWTSESTKLPPIIRRCGFMKSKDGQFFHFPPMFGEKPDKAPLSKIEKNLIIRFLKENPKVLILH